MRYKENAPKSKGKFKNFIKSIGGGGVSEGLDIFTDVVGDTQIWNLNEGGDQVANARVDTGDIKEFQGKKFAKLVNVSVNHGSETNNSVYFSKLARTIFDQLEGDISGVFVTGRTFRNTDDIQEFIKTRIDKIARHKPFETEDGIAYVL